MNKRTLAICLAVSTSLPLSLLAQRKLLGQTALTTSNLSAKPFTPYSLTSFASGTKAKDSIVKLPNKKSLKLSEYLAAINYLEGNLSKMGYAQNRTEKTVIVARLNLLPTTALAAATTKSTTVQTAPMTATVKNRFAINARLAPQTTKPSFTTVLKQAEIDAMPNESINRNIEFNPPQFSVGGYKTNLNGSVYLKGTVDPFSLNSSQKNAAGLLNEIKNTGNEFTAGLNMTVSAQVPEIGELVVYKLESEFTARSNASKKHSSKAKLTILQQVLINENQANISTEAYNFRQNRLYNVSKLIGAADIYTYGLNALMPVDFYLSAIGIGAEVDVQLDRTGVNGTVGPRLAQSVIMETSATEMLGPIGEGISNTVDAGVAGELRLIEGGLDYGFSLGLGFSGTKLILKNDMSAIADLEILRGRMYTFYQYPVFTCNNIIFQGLDLSCWEQRRVETDVFRTNALLSFKKTLVDDDKTEPVKWQ